MNHVSAQVTGAALVDVLLAGTAGLIVLAAVGLAAVLLGRHEAERRRQRHHDELQQDLTDQRADIERREHRLAERESRLDDEQARVAEESDRLAGAADAHQRELERVAGLTAEEARQEIVSGAEADATRHAAVLAREIERAATEQADMKAQKILATVIQRLASEQTTETVVTHVALSGDDMKGRIIGREGRNIRSFESVTGVNLVVDETPGAVQLSCFDPVRREMARLTLEELLADGRIHPARIEELHARSVREVERHCEKVGADTALEMGIADLHPELVATLGRLQYRTSYGQNVLRHLVESGHAAGLIADELGVDRAVCVRSAFLHDIGKALTHEAEGSHALVGAELARAHGEHPDVVHAIEAHHNEVEPRTVEALVTQAADAISGGRPGARRESLESYSERMHRLEEIALTKKGVHRVFAMQAGRDVRVMVLPDEVDDIAAQVLARDIAKQFEQELTYPGQIKVTVIRESRATEIAR